jgi:hypothetical protein
MVTRILRWRAPLGWRYVSEELAAAGVRAHLGDPAETATLRGPKERAKTDRADARLLRTLLVEGRFPASWIPPAQVVEMRTLGRLCCTLMDERRAWQQRIHASVGSGRITTRFLPCAQTPRQGRRSCSRHRQRDPSLDGRCSHVCRAD